MERKSECNSINLLIAGFVHLLESPGILKPVMESPGIVLEK
jgi:hypothetical protein